MLMGMLGHHAVAVTTGERALIEYVTFDPDVAIIDLGLADLDGCTVATRLRVSAGRRAPLLIAFTGWARQQDREQATRAGFDHYVVKSGNVHALEALVLSRSVSTECRRRTDPSAAIRRSTVRTEAP